VRCLWSCEVEQIALQSTKMLKANTMSNAEGKLAHLKTTKTTANKTENKKSQPTDTHMELLMLSARADSLWHVASMHLTTMFTTGAAKRM
jgi:hypothetical protein